jgi:hypothetical protein
MVDGATVYLHGHKKMVRYFYDIVLCFQNIQWYGHCIRSAVSLVLINTFPQLTAISVHIHKLHLLLQLQLALSTTTSQS